MTKQWELSGNAENVDWSDIAMAGRAYADNLIGEPGVSKMMHMMADEICRLNGRPLFRSPSLTTEERDALEWASKTLCVGWHDLAPSDKQRSRDAAATLRSLLERISAT